DREPQARRAGAARLLDPRLRHHGGPGGSRRVSVAAVNRRGTPSAFVISITPFDADGDIDFGALRAHFARLAESGVGVYVGGGGSGEGHALLPSEVDRLLEIAFEDLVGKVPTRAMGVEPRTARQMIELGDTR